MTDRPYTGALEGFVQHQQQYLLQVTQLEVNAITRFLYYLRDTGALVPPASPQTVTTTEQQIWDAETKTLEQDPTWVPRWLPFNMVPLVQEWKECGKFVGPEVFGASSFLYWLFHSSYRSAALALLDQELGAKDQEQEQEQEQDAPTENPETKTHASTLSPCGGESKNDNGHPWQRLYDDFDGVYNTVYKNPSDTAGLAALSSFMEFVRDRLQALGLGQEQDPQPGKGLRYVKIQD